jgi:hypothetical protein
MEKFSMEQTPGINGPERAEAWIGSEKELFSAHLKKLREGGESVANAFRDMGMLNQGEELFSKTATERTEAKLGFQSPAER